MTDMTHPQDAYAEFGPVLYAGLEAPPVPSESLGKIQERLILEGHSTKEILGYIKAHRPHAETSPACVAWYRAKLRREGRLAAYRH